MSPPDDVVLLVEDNPDDVFAFNWALKKVGPLPTVQVATDGQKAKDYLSGEAPFSDRKEFPFPTLIFLDLKLPYIDGMELLAWIRVQPEMAATRVVILSGSDERRDHENASKLGAEAYLVKPASPDDLRGILCRP